MANHAQFEHHNTQHITQLSRILRSAAGLMIWAVPLGLLWTWSHFEQLAAVLPATAGLNIDPTQVTTAQLAAAFSANMLAGAIAMFGFWRLRCLFELFTQSRYFDQTAISCVQGFAVAILSYGLVTPLSRTLIALSLTLNNPQGEAILMLRLSSDDIVIVFLGGVFFLLARVWHNAKRIADEHAQIV